MTSKTYSSAQQLLDRLPGRGHAGMHPADVQMPGLSGAIAKNRLIECGFDPTDRLRPPDMPIAPTIVAGQKAGCRGFLTKPASSQQTDRRDRGHHGALGVALQSTERVQSSRLGGDYRATSSSPGRPVHSRFKQADRRMTGKARTRNELAPLMKCDP